MARTRAAIRQERARRPGRRGRRIAVFLVLLLGMLAIVAILGNRHTVPDRAPQVVQASAQTLEQGRYLARAADCAACHQTGSGQAYAGGYPLKTPFGTIYGTNITPDPDQGIGRWTAEEFYRAVSSGRAPGNRLLYPAMPYTAYHTMTRADADAIYAYLMNIRPSPQHNRKPEVPFPLNVRVLMAGWNFLFFDKNDMPAASSGDSERWIRGRYLANVLGHCAECHTPRGQFGQLERGRWLQGYVLDRYLAPDLTPAALAARGWDQPALVQYLRTGLAEQAVASDEMYSVVMHSTQYLSDRDLNAIAGFLLGDRPPKAAVLAAALGVPVEYVNAGAAGAGSSAALYAGRQTYLNMCAGCHGASGEGKPETMPPLARNANLAQSDPRNLILAILDGLPARSYPDSAAMAGMPAFGQSLTDEEIATLANYLRTGANPAQGPAAPVAAQTVRDLRSAGR